MTKRLIPVLLLDRKKRLVKTVAFGARTYIGDPFNVVRLFNEKEVDEIVVLDIDASTDSRPPDFDFLCQLASECFMPLSYGGGIVSLDHLRQLNRIGIEKFVLGSAALDEPMVRGASAHFGAQAIVGCVDVIGQGPHARCAVRSAARDIARSPLQHALALQAAGVGEIIVQSVDRDGSRAGYDLGLIAALSSQLRVPVVALGGAGDALHLAQGLQAGAMAAASGSAFSFIGRLRAVLITYPDEAHMAALTRSLT